MTEAVLDGAAPAPARHFTAGYGERARLRDGTAVWLRLVVPEDKPLLLAGFRKLSPESRYARFLAPKDTLSEDELRYLTELDQEHHLAIGAIAEEDGGEVGVGVARFIRLPEPPRAAEAAIAVLDEMHGRGLGKLLFMRLCAAARERGIERFRCEVLGSNTGMRSLIEAVSPERRIEVGGGVMSIEMALPDVPPDELVTGPAPQGPMYRLFRAAAENAVEWTAAVRRLWRRE
jgi:GNAT superfamily N-acetyltransferase